MTHILRRFRFLGGIAMLHRYSLTTILALIAVVVIGGRALAEVKFGIVTAVRGIVTVTRGGSASPVRYAETVQVGDRIATGADGRVTLTVLGNSQLQLTESSTLDLAKNTIGPNGRRTDTRVNLLGGMVRSVIRSGAGSPPNFEISTPNAIVRGTAYDIEYRKGVSPKGYADCREFTEVSVYSGTAVVSDRSNPAARPVEVRAGQRTVVPCGLAPAFATASSGASTGLSTTAIGAMGALGIAGIGGGVTAAIAASGGSSGGFDPSPKSAASSSQ